MTRRVLVLLFVACCCRAADPAGEVIDLFTDVAGSLSAGNVSRFLAAFDSSMPGYARLRDNVTALAAQGEVQSFIDPIVNEGDQVRRAVELKWTLRIRRGQDTTPALIREQTVKAQVEKRRGKWHITQFDPVEFFSPIK